MTLAQPIKTLHSPGLFGDGHVPTIKRVNFIYPKIKDKDGEKPCPPDVSCCPGLSIVRANKFLVHLRQIKKTNSIIEI